MFFTYVPRFNHFDRYTAVTKNYSSLTLKLCPKILSCRTDLKWVSTNDQVWSFHLYDTLYLCSLDYGGHRFMFMVYGHVLMATYSPLGFLLGEPSTSLPSHFQPFFFYLKSDFFGLLSLIEGKKLELSKRLTILINRGIHAVPAGRFSFFY